mmetsp:Transcript_95118/g.165227  ORF Transcript_95118/g.165227 Transcript_95118/m.165227 type:complete len:271 (-) Transcript_95118:532-1344(-)
MPSRMYKFRILYIGPFAMSASMRESSSSIVRCFSGSASPTGPASGWAPRSDIPGRLGGHKSLALAAAGSPLGSNRGSSSTPANAGLPLTFGLSEWSASISSSSCAKSSSRSVAIGLIGEAWLPRSEVAPTAIGSVGISPGAEIPSSEAVICDLSSVCLAVLGSGKGGLGGRKCLHSSSNEICPWLSTSIRPITSSTLESPLPGKPCLCNSARVTTAWTSSRPSTPFPSTSKIQKLCQRRPRRDSQRSPMQPAANSAYSTWPLASTSRHST